MVVNTTPIAAPRSTLPAWWMSCVNAAVSTPASAAPTRITAVSRLSITRKAAAMPGSTAWLMASPIMLMRRSTRKLPISAHAMALTAATTTIPVSR